MRLVLDAERRDVPALPVRLLGDGIHGTVHLPRLSSAGARADAVLLPGEPLRLAAGTLPGGLPLRLEVYAKRTE